MQKKYTHTNPFIRIRNALKYSLKGLKSAYISEAAFRQDIAIFICNTVAVFFVSGQAMTALLFFAGLLIVFAELINTAIEYIVDLVTQEHQPLAGAAKDVGSSLVFLAVINWIVCWIIYFIKS